MTLIDCNFILLIIVYYLSLAHFLLLHFMCCWRSYIATILNEKCDILH